MKKACDPGSNPGGAIIIFSEAECLFNNFQEFEPQVSNPERLRGDKF